MLPLMDIYVFNEGTIFFIKYICTVFIIFLSLFYLFKFGKINTFSILTFFYFFFTLFSSIINNTLSIGIFFSIFIMLAFTYVISLHTNNFLELIKALYYLYSFVVVINFLTMIILPNGIYLGNNLDPIYFLGGKNSIQMVVLPAIPIILIYSYYIYNRMKFMPIIILLTCVTSLYLSTSGTSIVIFVCMICFLLLYKKLSLTFNFYLIIYIALFLLIVIYRLQEKLFGNFIVNVLHKDITFTGRTYIWDIVLENIHHSWLIGFGRGNSLIFKNTLKYSEAHNGILEILQSSGLIGVFLFFIILIFVGRQLFLYKEYIFSKILAFSLFSYLLIGLTESAFGDFHFWLLIILSANIGAIVNQYKVNKLKKEGN